MTQINYELAKSMKDAGFPQELHLNEWWSSPHGPFLLDEHNATRLKDEDVRLPTLSELIEACGEEFVALQRVGYLSRPSTSNDEWQAWSRENRYPVGTGSTPEEAVARLWLALNSK